LPFENIFRLLRFVGIGEEVLTFCVMIDWKRTGSLDIFSPQMIETTEKSNYGFQEIRTNYDLT